MADVGDSSSEDEAPEQVTFQRGREEAAQNQKREKQAAQREKALLKEKRRRREELFKEQKKRKLLPVAVLEEAAAQPQSRPNEISSKQETGNDAVPSESGDKKSEEEQSEEEIANTSVQVNYKAMQLKEQDEGATQQQTAKDFIHNRLYGSGTKRTTVNQFFSVVSKKGAIKKPAIQFVNSAWGKEKKQKAKRFKSRWVNKLIPPT